MFGRQQQRLAAGRCLQGPITGRPKHVSKELHVLLVVFDHENLLASHRYLAATGRVNTNVLPCPGWLSTRDRRSSAISPCSRSTASGSRSPPPVLDTRHLLGQLSIIAWGLADRPAPVTPGLSGEPIAPSNEISSRNV